MRDHIIRSLQCPVIHFRRRGHRHSFHIDVFTIKLSGGVAVRFPNLLKECFGRCNHARRAGRLFGVLGCRRPALATTGHTRDQGSRDKILNRFHFETPCLMLEQLARSQFLHDEERAVRKTCGKLRLDHHQQYIGLPGYSKRLVLGEDLNGDKSKLSAVLSPAVRRRCPRARATSPLSPCLWIPTPWAPRSASTGCGWRTYPLRGKTEARGGAGG